MYLFFATAIVALMTISVAGADSKERVPFALYPVAPKQGAGTKPYTFTSVMSGKAYAGFYHDKAVVPLAGIESFEVTYIELGAAPCPAFSFRFTKSGAALLQATMKATPDVEFVVIIDGHCYSTVPAETLKSVLDKDRKLNIAVFGKSDDMTRHLMQLIVEKLAPMLPKP